jgi:hypothetical protein
MRQTRAVEAPIRKITDYSELFRGIRQSMRMPFNHLTTLTSAHILSLSSLVFLL